MADQPDKIKKLSDATVSIYRAARQFENDLCDRMVVQYRTGSEDDVVVYTQNGKRKVARLRLGLTMTPASSPAISVSTGGTEGLEPVDAEEEKSLLALYDSVESTL
jgi:hypothetical protein